LRIAGLDPATAQEPEETIELEETADSGTDGAGRSHYGVTLSQLTSAGSLKPGTRLVFNQRGEEAEAVINASGEIVLDGVAYKRPSGAASKVLGGRPINGWEAWRLGAEGPTLAEIRAQFLAERAEVA